MQYEIECTCTTVYGWDSDPIGRVVDHRCGVHGRSAAARAKRLTFALVADGVNPAAAPLVDAVLYVITPEDGPWRVAVEDNLRAAARQHAAERHARPCRIRAVGFALGDGQR